MRQGCIWGELGAGSHMLRKRGPMSAQASPLHCLTERDASLLSLFLVRTGRKGSSGAKPPAPAPAASTHATWCGGAGGAPSSSSSRRQARLPSHLPARPGPDGSPSEGTCSGLGAGEGVLPPLHAQTQGSAAGVFGKEGEGGKGGRPSLVSQK